MCPPPKLPPEAIQALFDEMENFQDLAAQLKPLPGEVPALEGIDIHGEVIPCSGPIGGDHIIYIDFKKRFDLAARIRRAQAARRWRVARRLEENYRQAGILLADVAGHRITDALLTAMLHQAFLLGVQYELEISGTITVRLFEYINKRFYQSSAVGKFLTMIYGRSTSRAGSGSSPRRIRRRRSSASSSTGSSRFPKTASSASRPSAPCRCGMTWMSAATPVCWGTRTSTP